MTKNVKFLRSLKNNRKKNFKRNISKKKFVEYLFEIIKKYKYNFGKNWAWICLSFLGIEFLMIHRL